MLSLWTLLLKVVSVFTTWTSVMELLLKPVSQWDHQAVVSDWSVLILSQIGSNWGVETSETEQIHSKRSHHHSKFKSMYSSKQLHNCKTPEGCEHSSLQAFYERRDTFQCCSITVHSPWKAFRGFPFYSKLFCHHSLHYHANEKWVSDASQNSE